MKPSLILICISTNWCQYFYDVNIQLVCSLPMSPQHPLIRTFHFQKKKTFLVAKDPPMGILKKKLIPFLKVTKEFFVQRGGGYRGLLRKGHFRYYFHNVYNDKIEVVLKSMLDISLRR